MQYAIHLGRTGERNGSASKREVLFSYKEDAQSTQSGGNKVAKGGEKGSKRRLEAGYETVQKRNSGVTQSQAE